MRQSRKRKAELWRADDERKRILWKRLPFSKLIEGGGEDERWSGRAVTSLGGGPEEFGSSFSLRRPNVSGRKRQMGIARSWRERPMFMGSQTLYCMRNPLSAGAAEKQNRLAAFRRKKVLVLGRISD